MGLASIDLNGNESSLKCEHDHGGCCTYIKPELRGKETLWSSLNTCLGLFPSFLSPLIMGKLDERALLILAICVLAVHTPAEAWYKQAAGPSYYSVGRASGLLAGIRRSAIRRDEHMDTLDSREVTDQHAIFQQINLALKNMVSPWFFSCAFRL